MKLISWNVNGIRAGFNKDTFKQVFEMGADVIAVQETKCEREQLKAEQLNYNGYSSVFESAKNRKGYSGVAVYVKPGIKYKVLHATLNKKDFYDEEGRTIVLQFDNFYFINCYWPNGGKSEEH
jgi:exodeoxyribonuclease-3